jgi:hypothetical protein
MNAPLPKGQPAPGMTQRQRDEATIRHHFGTNTRLGRKLLNEVIVKYNEQFAERVLDALPDEALSELAAAHRAAADERTVKNYLGPSPDGDDR